MSTFQYVMTLNNNYISEFDHTIKITICIMITLVRYYIKVEEKFMRDSHVKLPSRTVITPRISQQITYGRIVNTMLEIQEVGRVSKIT